jgi:hypothetical protein
MKNQVQQLANLINQKREKPIPRSWIRFLGKYIETGQVTEAAMQTFDVKDRNSASAYGGKVMKKLGVSNEMQAAMAQHGMTRDWRLGILKRNTENGSDKALEMSFKLSGELEQQPATNVQVNVLQHFRDQQEKYK